MALRFFRRSQPAKPVPTETTVAAETTTSLEPTTSQREQVQKAKEFGERLGSSHASQQDVAPASEPVPKLAPEQQDTVLTDEDERFLERLVSDAEGDPIRHDDSADEALLEEGEKDASREPHKQETKLETAESTAENKKRKSWFSMPEGYSLAALTRMSTFERQKSDQGLPMPATTPNEARPNRKQEQDTDQEESAEEQAKERKDVHAILNRLHLDTDSLNNRAISLSEDSKKLLADFNQLVKDVISGAPYAYDDLEAFFKHRQADIEKLYDSLPPFMQSFVKALPAKLVTTYAPELAAAAGMAATGAASASADSKSKRSTDKGGVPSLRKLISQRGAVASMLRSTIAFLEARFPILLGWTNVLISLALFLLLFIFWYCWKRGHDERRAKEDVDAEVAEGAKEPLSPAELEEAHGADEREGEKP